MEKASTRHSIIPISVPCFDYTDDGYQRERRTIIIAPIIVKEIEVGLVEVGYGCSRGPYCYDKSCRYAYGYKKKEEDSHNED